MLKEPCSFAKVPHEPPYLDHNILRVQKRRNPNMYLWVRPRPHTHSERGLRFPPQYHASYKWRYYSTPLHKDVFSGWSGKKAGNDLGLCPVKGKLSGLCSWARARNQFSSLSLSTTRTMTHCQMLVIHRLFNVIIDILPRDPKGWLRSHNFWVEPPLASLLGISIPHTPASPGTHYSPTVCQVEL